MAVLPDQPFLAQDFSPPGAGLDFLGMRWVNLEMLTTRLLPDINNATSDFGTYCLAAWIPWKFRQLCGGDGDGYKYSSYRRFRESVEVAVAHAVRDDSPASSKWGRPNLRIGVQQKLSLPGPLTFARAKRTDSTSLYAAPLYGPSLRFLQVIRGEAVAKDGSSSGILLTSEDEAAMSLVREVEQGVSRSRYYDRLSTMGSEPVAGNVVDDLGVHGLHPAYYRRASRKAKLAFLSMLVPQDSRNARTLTARLLVETLRASPGLDVEGVREVWHCGLLHRGSRFAPRDAALNEHREVWALFQTRQYQRFVVEMFLKCFEAAILDRRRTIDDIVDHTLTALAHVPRRLMGDFSNWVAEEMAPVSKSDDNAVASAHWAERVHPGHPSYIGSMINDEEIPDAECAIRMLARWWIAAHKWVTGTKHADLLTLGGEDRMSMRWFFLWTEQRMGRPLTSFMRDVYQRLVISQHVRVALSRFDGVGQRLRFTLGDEGIVPTRSMAAKLTEGIPGWTADRLDAFVSLLSDIGVIDRADDGTLGPGALSDIVCR